MTTKKSRHGSFLVRETEGERRLDLWLANESEMFSRTELRKMIDLGGVHVNGCRVRKCSYTLRRGDQVDVYRDMQPLNPFRLSDADILYRDRYLLALNKPSGVDTQPTPARYKGTLYEALLTFLKDPYRPLDKPELAMVQRLDRETSGVMIFSIHKRAHKPLTELWQSRQVRKVYHALVQDPGLDEQGEFVSQLARNRKSNRMKSVEHGGKQAHTLYRILHRMSGHALVEVELLTGRMHQIRAHFSEAGAPLLGDRLYGGELTVKGLAVPRTMLHSSHLVCDHPVNQHSLNLEAPLPEDFNRMLSLLKEEQ